MIGHRYGVLQRESLILPFSVTANSPYLIASNLPNVSQWTSPTIQFTPHNAAGSVSLVSVVISSIDGYVWNDIRTHGPHSSFRPGVTGTINQFGIYDFTATLIDGIGSPISCWMFKVVATYQDSLSRTASAETLVAGLTGDNSFISNTLALSAFTGSGTTSATSNQQTMDLSAMGGQIWTSSYWIGVNNADLVDPTSAYAFNFTTHPTSQPVKQSIGISNASAAETIYGLVFYGIIQNDESSNQFWTPIVPATMTMSGP